MLQVTAKNTSAGKSFNSLTFSADGTALLGGGNSKFVCLYDVAERMLLRKYVLSDNAALDGVRMQLNSADQTDAGNTGDLLLDEDSDDPSAPPAAARAVTRRSERVTRLTIRAACVRFAPDGRSWAAASTEGLVIYSLDEALRFDPTDLELTTTPATVAAAVEEGAYGRAVPMALCLNEPLLIRAVWARVPPVQIDLVSQVPLHHSRPRSPPNLQRTLPRL